MLGVHHLTKRLVWEPVLPSVHPYVRGECSTAPAILAGRARGDSSIHTLHNRVAWRDADLWYDLTDRDWRAVRIFSGGREIVDHPPVLFRRHSHHAPQVTPASGGNPERLLDFVNVSDDDRLLFLVYAPGCLVPDIPHPVLILAGPQGSAKATAARVLRRLVDPSTLGALVFPCSEKGTGAATPPPPARPLWDEFDIALPGILGGAFDALAEAVRVRPSLRFDGLPRMADFAAWGTAISIGLGYRQEEWMEVYQRGIAERHGDAVEANPFASAVVAMMHGRPEWRGTATLLVAEAHEAARIAGIDTSSGVWPGDARWASERLHEAEINLGQPGISMSSKRTAAGRRFTYAIGRRRSSC